MVVDPARVRRAATVWRLAVAWLVVLALVATGACSWPGSDERDAPYLVSYSGATLRLAMLDQREATEQLRDWARLGLASQLRLDRDQVVDALYNSTPIRDPAFAELVDQPTGPGRALFDGSTLHVLVPQDDPHRSRTIGLLLDEHRADAGSDPARVQVHRYQVRPERQHIELFAEPPVPTGQIRAENGWREARIDQPQGLAEFLNGTNHLSRLETKGSRTWAAGWHWPDAPGAEVTAEDIAVLQRGYQQTSGPLPGFSLDPQRVSTLDDLRATIPGLAPALAEAVISGNWAGSGYASAAELADLVKHTLFNQQPPAEMLPARGLPADRTQLWALRNLLEDRPVYSQARYDGGLAGTEVGMTLFYTDLVAKKWTTGVGNGVPSKAVPGFVPSTQADTPASICPRGPHEESGRLWFGQADNAFSFRPNGVDIGAAATRLFARSEGPSGTEVEPSYTVGRGLRWWDEHYQQIADYEPQYHRLGQLMRWSGALEWLTTEQGGGLPVPPGSEISSRLSFADWYAAHDELRERAPLTLVTPPSAKQEAVLPEPSDTTTNCGLLQIVGGVSLADRLARGADVPSGPTRELRHGPDAVSIETTGSAGESGLRGQTEQRTAEIVVRSEGRDVNFDAAADGTRIANVDAHVPASSGVQQTTITVQLVSPRSHLHEAIKRVLGNRADRARDRDNADGPYQGVQGIAAFGDVLGAAPPDIPIYVSDVASRAGAEPPATLPGAIPAPEAPVHIRMERGGPNTPGPTWRWLDRASISGGGPGGDGGGFDDDRRGPDWWILITVCPNPDEQPQQSEECVA
ncbi:MAG: hypothetical protein ACRDRZ_01195 [Pseudonocardiaceae bacterium]